MIYDCFMFFNENDIVEIRLNQHWDFVDKFIIVEMAETHTGLKKDLIFDHDRFKKYSSKIVYKSFNSFSELQSQYPNIISHNIYKTVSQQSNLYLSDWIRDNIQAEYLSVLLSEQNPKPSDMVLFSCADEILNEQAFRETAKIFSESKGFDLYCHILNKHITESNDFRPVVSFELDLYAYKFNLFSKKIPVGCMTQFSNLSKIKHTELRYYSISTHESIKNAGWHFTFLDNTDGEKALSKYKSWAHSRDSANTRKQYFDTLTKEEAVQNIFRDYSLTKIDITPERYPKFLIENLAKYSNYIY